MAGGADRNSRKFAEPRSWAGKWCGYGLAGRAPRTKAVRNNQGKFAEPRGWSAKWCVRGLSNGRER
jgi:hypothetical protein